MVEAGSAPGWRLAVTFFDGLTDLRHRSKMKAGSAATGLTGRRQEDGVQVGAAGCWRLGRDVGEATDIPGFAVLKDRKVLGGERSTTMALNRT